jgi:hypothetical protein
MEVFKSLWRGELSLARTYWLFGFSAMFLIKIPLILWEEYPPATPLLPGLVAVIGIIYFLFISVAIWRSANNYKGKMIWPALAKLQIICGVLAFFGEFVKPHKPV